MLEYLLRLDHLTSTMDRLLITLRLLAGGTLGRQRPETPLADVLRAGAGSIPGHDHVRLLDLPDVTVARRCPAGFPRRPYHRLDPAGHTRLHIAAAAAEQPAIAQLPAHRGERPARRAGRRDAQASRCQGAR